VVYGNRKTKVNEIGPPIKPKTQDQPTQSQTCICCNGIRPFKIIQKNERETLQKIPAKGKRRETHVMLSFPPLFSTELKANKGSTFPR
jgi:hypothetical protein